MLCMKKLFFISVLFLTFMEMAAQDSKVIVKHKISSRVEKVIDYEDGLSDKRITKEQHFDKEGHLIEYKDWTKDGKIKEWKKYCYNEGGLIQSEETLDAKGRMQERVVYEYENGLKVKKSYYDGKERLVKEKFYEYSYY